MFFLDSAHVTVAVTLDVADEVTPLGKEEKDSHDLGKYFQFIVLAIKASYELRLLMFYWNKLFNGNKDLFSRFTALESIPVAPHTDLGTSVYGGDDRIVQII